MKKLALLGTMAVVTFSITAYLHADAQAQAPSAPAPKAAAPVAPVAPISAPEAAAPAAPISAPEAAVPAAPVAPKAVTKAGPQTSVQAGLEQGDKIIEKIKTHLKNVYYLSQDVQTMEISHDKGSVTLKGYVANQEEKNMIINFVEALPGVSRVTDQLEVRK